MSLRLKQQNHSCTITSTLLPFSPKVTPLTLLWLSKWYHVLVGNNLEAQLKTGQILVFNKHQLQDFPPHMEFSCE